MLHDPQTPFTIGQQATLSFTFAFRSTGTQPNPAGNFIIGTSSSLMSTTQQDSAYTFNTSFTVTGFLVGQNLTITFIQGE